MKLSYERRNKAMFRLAHNGCKRIVYGSASVLRAVLADIGYKGFNKGMMRNTGDSR
jgi:ABC-type hemin transport system substrate-binding protein